MAWFEAFTPEGMLKAMGINQADLLAEYALWKAEFEGMKAATRDATGHFNARITLLEKQQAAMLALLVEIDAHVTGKDQTHVAKSLSIPIRLGE